MKRVLSIILFVHCCLAVQAQQVKTETSVSGSGSLAAPAIYDTMITVGSSFVLAPTFEGARSMALQNAIGQAAAFADTAFVRQVISADEAVNNESWIFEVRISTNKTETAYEATAVCSGKRRAANSLMINH